jgi:hypothetical protein
VHEVKDGSRTLKFDGVLLALSTSYRTGTSRWVEFTLYRTTGGQYVLARIGQTTLYHAPDCVIAERNGLRETPRASLKEGSVPCSECMPSLGDSEMVRQELPRYWAQVSETPEGVVDSVHRYDGSGSRYLTGVARRLLEDASLLDEDIFRAYREETIF